MATIRRASPPRPGPKPPANGVSHLELIELFHRRAVHELVVLQIPPLFYRLEAIIA